MGEGGKEVEVKGKREDEKWTAGSSWEERDVVVGRTRGASGHIL